MFNHSRVTEFILHGFSDNQQLQVFHLIVFPIIYFAALMENLIIITIIICTHYLHKPMYFFLTILAFQDLGSISVTVPKSIANSWLNIESISYSGCICQVFFLIFFSASHFFILGAMAYDRYVAICNPLQYEAVMNRKACIEMATGAWSLGLLYSITYTGHIFMFDFCSNEIHQFFCDIPQLIKISCSDSYVITLWVIAVCYFIASIFSVLIFSSYVEIFTAVVRIPSTRGKEKAFSTCLPHLFVIFLYLISSAVAYLGSTSKSTSTKDLLVSIFYCVVPPLINPLIYSMKNTELKMAFWKLIVKLYEY